MIFFVRPHLQLARPMRLEKLWRLLRSSQSARLADASLWCSSAAYRRTVVARRAASQARSQAIAPTDPLRPADRRCCERGFH